MLHLGNYFEFELFYKTSILRLLPAKVVHFYTFDPYKAKILTFDLSFNNYDTVRRRQVKLYFL